MKDSFGICASGVAVSTFPTGIRFGSIITMNEAAEEPYKLESNMSRDVYSNRPLALVMTRGPSMKRTEDPTIEKEMTR